MADIRNRGLSKSENGSTLADKPVARRASAAAEQGGPSSKGSGVALILKALGVYVCFLYWGYCQERVTTTSYAHKDPQGPPGKWGFMIPLNMMMASAASVVGFVVYHATGGSGSRAAIPLRMFWKSALSNTIASPIGYLSLRFIPFPLMLLVKNCKLIPVMLVGALLNGVRYTRLEYASVGLISAGVALFMLKPSKGGAAVDHGSSEQQGQLLHWVLSLAASAASAVSVKELAGVGLAALNLLIDGFTNSEQDRLVQRYQVSPYYMMLGVNCWSVLFASLYLLGNWALKGWDASDVGGVAAFVANYPAVRLHLLAFALSNAVGQVFIFSLIEEFGSLVAVTVTITRKMMSIIISIVWFNHATYWWQWAGFGVLCGGIGVGIVAKGQKGKHKQH